MKKKSIGLVIASCMLLSACSTTSSSSGRYSIANDHGPSEDRDLSHIKQPIPKYEPKSLGGNRNYTVWGNAYQVLDTAKGYHEKGIASWYGRKFHGHLTANGETYDMYAFTAAHKTLPLPTYAQVTNLRNGKHVIVRINDRGPFHDNRLIDLSYVAAKRLGIVATGTAPVRVDAIVMPPPWQQTNTDVAQVTHSPTLEKPTASQDEIMENTLQTDPSPEAAKPESAEAKPTNTVAAQHVKPKETLTNKKGTSANGGWYVQVLATSDADAASQTGVALSQVFTIQSRTISSGKWYRLQLGPLASEQAADQLATKLHQAHYPGAFTIYEEPEH